MPECTSCHGSGEEPEGWDWRAHPGKEADASRYKLLVDIAVELAAQTTRTMTDRLVELRTILISLENKP